MALPIRPGAAGMKTPPGGESRSGLKTASDTQLNTQLNQAPGNQTPGNQTAENRAKPDFTAWLASEFQRPAQSIGNVIKLLDEDNTIPFIARYRKEVSGSMDEVQLRSLRDRLHYLRELEERRATVLSSIREQGKLTAELEAKINALSTKRELEDLYLPYRPKRKTRASAAREKGLEPLALALFIEGVAEGMADAVADRMIAEFIGQFAGSHGGEINGEIGAEEVWAGCRDILAERVAEDADTRSWIRGITEREGKIVSAPTREFAGQKTKFSDYYAYAEPLARIPAHRYLAMRRGENEKVLKVRIAAPEEDILERQARNWGAGARGRMKDQWGQLLEDAYRRLIAPAVEVELRVALKERADGESISIFAENLTHLLLQPPGGHKVVLGLDPGFRTGSKWVVVDRTGKLLDHGAIFPLPPGNQVGQSAQAICRAIEAHHVEVVAIGNGTASRELLSFVRKALADARIEIPAVLVSEAGASVYSASDTAREEFPDLDITIRGAVSIARRWQDPLAELVKIDPKSIGVGQYQHDVQPTRLRQTLDEVVESCVNRVGVNLNTASLDLLRYVSGIGAAQAKEIIVFREARGSFTTRGELERVPRLGPKAFQQCAGFLRIPGAANPLDGSAVHPEHYPVVESMAADLRIPLPDLMGNDEAIAGIDLNRYAGGGTGLPTLEDILEELRKPGLDPRAPQEAVVFDDRITKIGHVEEGMRLNGIVTNVTHFGAFVDIGVHQDGLVHISQLADHFVKRPQDEVRVGQTVRVTVLKVDTELGRIGLSMKKQPGATKSGQNGGKEPRK